MILLGSVARNTDKSLHERSSIVLQTHILSLLFQPQLQQPIRKHNPDFSNNRPHTLLAIPSLFTGPLGGLSHGCLIFTNVLLSFLTCTFARRQLPFQLLNTHVFLPQALIILVPLPAHDPHINVSLTHVHVQHGFIRRGQEDCVLMNFPRTSRRGN